MRPTRRSRARAGLLAAAANGGLLVPALLASALRGPGRAVLGPTGALFVLALLFAAGEAAAQEGQDAPGMRPDPATLLTGLCTYGILATALAFPAPRVALPVALVGAGLVLAGIAGRLASLRALGPRFVSEPRVLPPGARVRTGPYRLADHPSELGLLAIGAGAAILCGSLPAAALVAGALLPLMVLRTGREDLVLARSA